METPIETTAAPSVEVPRLVSPAKLGTEDWHRAELERLKARGVCYIWAGAVKHSRYLAETLRFGENAGIFTMRRVELSTERGWEISWANTDSQAKSVY
jgi:hypothetical protein